MGDMSKPLRVALDHNMRVVAKLEAQLCVAENTISALRAQLAVLSLTSTEVSQVSADPSTAPETDEFFTAEWSWEPIACRRTACTARVARRPWQSNDGAFEDWQYRCEGGHTWWTSPPTLQAWAPLTPAEKSELFKPREPFTNPPMRIVQLIAGAHGTLYALDDHGRAWAYAENFTSDGRDSSAWQLLSPLPRSP